MNPVKYGLVACLILFSGFQHVLAEDVNSIDEKVKDLVHMDGFFDLYWDQRKGQLLLRIDNMGNEFIYQSSLARGVGSNDLGLDRGQLGSTRWMCVITSSSGYTDPPVDGLMGIR